MTSGPASNAFAIRGVIEGFYGTPWTEEQRLDMVECIGRWGMNTFVYSPKDDPFLREDWAKPFDDEILGRLRRLIAQCQASGVTLSVAMSPGLSMKYSDPSHRSALKDKVGSLLDLGVEALGLYFDDIPGSLQWPEDQSEFESLGLAHASVVEDVAAFAKVRGATHISVCPTVYWGDANAPYLSELAGGINADIDLFWTGRSICSATLDTTDSDQFRARTGRNPLYWDNFPVNDVAMKHELHIGPYERRDPALASASKGVIVNAMEYAESSKIAIYTIAEFLRSPADYDPEESWTRALSELAGHDEDYLALRAFAENSRSSCLSLSDAVPITEALQALEFSLVSEDYASGAQAVSDIADRYLRAAKHLLHGNLTNPRLIEEMRPWWEAFELGAGILRRLATLAENRQLETSRVRELETDLTHLRALGRRVFGDSLDMALEHYVQRVQPTSP